MCYMLIILEIPNDVAPLNDPRPIVNVSNSGRSSNKYHFRY